MRQLPKRRAYQFFGGIAGDVARGSIGVADGVVVHDKNGSRGCLRQHAQALLAGSQFGFHAFARADFRLQKGIDFGQLAGALAHPFFQLVFGALAFERVAENALEYKRAEL